MRRGQNFQWRNGELPNLRCPAKKWVDSYCTTNIRTICLETTILCVYVSLSVSQVDLVDMVYLEDAKIKWLNDPQVFACNIIMGFRFKWGEELKLRTRGIYVQLSGLCQRMIWWIIVSTLVL